MRSQCYLHIETSQLICTANQMIGFSMDVTLASDGFVKIKLFQYIFSPTFDIIKIKDSLTWRERLWTWALDS